MTLSEKFEKWYEGRHAWPEPERSAVERWTKEDLKAAYYEVEEFLMFSRYHMYEGEDLFQRPHCGNRSPDYRFDAQKDKYKIWCPTCNADL